MAKLPMATRVNIFPKKMAVGGTAAEDNPTTTGGVGQFPSATGITSPISEIIPESKIGLTEGEKLAPQPLTMQSNEELQAINVAQADPVTKTTGSTTGLEIPVPQVQATNKYTAYTVPDTPEAIAAQGTLSQESKIGDIQGAVSDEAVASAAQGTVNEKATVKYQLGQLFESIKTGEELPPWAAPAVRNVTAQMQARGLGASSMAAAAITQSIMEAGVPIAAADAQTYSRMELQNLSNEQQTTLQNAMTYAAMDKANLDARMTAAVNNAKSFLTIDAQNLTQSQQANTLTFQSQVQKLFTNQSQENASRQFNAKSENQVMEFFAELGVQAENANKTRVAAMEQFNADQSNAMERFGVQMNDSRTKFNANMSAQINQSNAQWRRQINTQNTADVNESNRLNAQALLGLNATAQAQVWQRYRDEAQWVLQRTESALQRAHQFAISSQQNDFAVDQYETEFSDSILLEVGQSALELLGIPAGSA